MEDQLAGCEISNRQQGMTMWTNDNGKDDSVAMLLGETTKTGPKDF